jgi:hypothetical protein
MDIFGQMIYPHKTGMDTWPIYPILHFGHSSAFSPHFKCDQFINPPFVLMKARSS